MAIKKSKKLIINLSGPEGNAFYLLGKARGIAKKIGLDHEQVIREMQESDYENLIKVFDKYFGNYVDLIR